MNRTGSWLEKNSKWMVPLVLVGAFAARVAGCWGYILNPDEAWHFELGRQASLASAYRASLDIAHPPLLILIMWVCHWFTSSAFALRLPCIFAGTAFAGFMYLWVRRIAGSAAAWIALLLAAFHPILIPLSYQIRQYALMLVFLGAALWLLECALAKYSASLMALATLAVCLAIYSQYSAMLVAAAMGAYALARVVLQRSPRRFVLHWAVCQCVTVGFMAWLYFSHIVVLHHSKMEEQVMSTPLSRLYDSYFHAGREGVVPFLINRILVLFEYFVSGHRLNDIAVLVYGAVVVLLLFRTKDEMQTRINRALFVFLTVPFVIAAAAALGGMYPLGASRHDIYFFIYIAAAFSIGMAAALRNRIGPSAAAGVLLAVVLQVLVVRWEPNIQETWTDASAGFAYMQKNIPTSDTVFVEHQTALELNYYVCPDRPLPQSTWVDGYASFECGGFHVISTDRRTPALFVGNFRKAWDGMADRFGLKPHDTVWVIHVGFASGVAKLGEQFQGKQYFDDVELNQFGPNFEILKLVVGSELPELPADNLPLSTGIAVLSTSRLRMR